MADAFDIYGGYRLSGSVSAGGSKNASFPVLAATVLLSEPITIYNLPEIEDITCFLDILKDLGAKVNYLDLNTVNIDPTTINKTFVPQNLGSKIRGSYYLLGSLLAKFGEATIPYPGGCNVGERPIDLHIQALKKMGVVFKDDGNKIEGKVSNNSQFEEIVNIDFPFPSRGATINVILAASLNYRATTKVNNANNSPETESLLNFLSLAGIELNYRNTSLSIRGIQNPSLKQFRVIPDKIEVATLLAVGLITHGEVTVKGAIVDHVQLFIDKLVEIGYSVKIERDQIFANKPPEVNLKPVQVISGLTPPCIDADFEPLLASLLTTVNGDSLIEDAINPQRHAQFIPQLNQMGANIEMVDNSKAIIHGGSVFHPSQVLCKEIRGGVAITLAALSANGQSKVLNVQQIDRGYEKIERKLLKLGAKISRINY